MCILSKCCTLVGFVLAAAVQTVKKFLCSPKLWPNIRSHLRTMNREMLQQHQRCFWKALTYVCRRKRRLEKYLAGAGRAAIHIDRDLQRSLSSNESSVLSEEDIPADMAAKRQKRVEECSRGCPAVLQNLAKTYQSVGRHCWPVRMYRQNKYPVA